MNLLFCELFTGPYQPNTFDFLRIISLSLLHYQSIRCFDMFLAFLMMVKHLLVTKSFLASEAKQRILYFIIISDIVDPLANIFPAVERGLLPFLLKSLVELKFDLRQVTERLGFFEEITHVLSQ